MEKLYGGEGNRPHLESCSFINDVTPINCIYCNKWDNQILNDKIQEGLDILVEISILKDNWNKYAAKSPDKEAFYSAVSYLRYLGTHEPKNLFLHRISPSPVGGVGITLKNKTNSFERRVYIEFMNDNQTFVLFSEGHTIHSEEIKKIDLLYDRCYLFLNSGEISWKNEQTKILYSNL